MTNEKLTKENAINLLKQVNKILINNNSWLKSTHEPLNQAFDMAIKALEQQPCEDCVSRAEVNKLYDEYRPRLATHVSEFGDKLKALPSITPTETMPDNEQKVLVSPCFGRIF